MKIQIMERNPHGMDYKHKEYESDVVPMIGDLYAGYHFNDGHSRKINARLLFPDLPGIIAVFTEYAYPSIAPKKTELNTTSEMDLVTTLS